MVEKIEKIADVSRENEKQSLQVLEKLIGTARPDSVFSKPIKVGDTQIITASEVQIGMGFGFGLGSGPHFITLPENSNPGVIGQPTSSLPDL